MLNILVVLLLTGASARADLSAVTPDPNLTPGVADPAVTQANIHSTICVSGYTARVRSVPESEKEEVYRRYNVTTRAPGEYEVDHLISLEIGGANDVRNLWPQSYLKNPGAHQKDDVENALHRAICCDSMTLADAQKAITSNWLDFYTRLKNGSWVPCTKTARTHPKGVRAHKVVEEEQTPKSVAPNDEVPAARAVEGGSEQEVR